MKTRILLGTVLGLSLVLLQASAFAQAAAESVMVGAASAGTTVKAGSALGSALNRVTRQLGTTVEETVQPTTGRVLRVGAQPASRIPARGTAAATGSAEGPMIASIQGTTPVAAPTCASASQAAPTPGNKPASGSTPAACGAQNSSGTPAPQKSPQKYRSVITLSSPQ
jgi:hypothetical protein